MNQERNGRVFAAIAVVFLCTSCGPTYIEPPASGSDVAYLTVPEPTSGHDMAVSTFTDPEFCTGQSMLRVGTLFAGNAPVSTSFVRIHAGDPSTFRIILVKGTPAACSPFVNFVPQAGRYYRIEAADNPGTNTCHATVTSADNPSMANARVEDVRRPRLHEPLFSGSRASWCTPG